MSDKKAIRSDIRHNYVFGRVKDFLTVGDAAIGDKLSLHMEHTVAEGSDAFMMVNGFLQGTGCANLLFTYQPEEGSNEDVLRVLDPARDAIGQIK